MFLKDASERKPGRLAILVRVEVRARSLTGTRPQKSRDFVWSLQSVAVFCPFKILARTSPTDYVALCEARWTLV